MSRRASATFVPKAAPFRIVHENISGGKHIDGAKRKLRWRFGWTDSEQEHEVNLKHSLTSGKKVVIEDGREITTSSSLFASEFSHGWNSDGHMFRVEANTPLGSDPVYIFSIDGVKFDDFQERPAPGSFTKRDEEPKIAPRVSESAPVKKQLSAAPVANKPSFNSKGSDSFDAFGPSSAPADPFAAPASKSTDPFGAGPSSHAADPFAPSVPKATSAANFDPFAPPPAPAPAQSNNFSGFESQGQGSSDPFFSGAPAARDPFAHPPAGSQATFAKQAAGQPTRRASAQDIMGDFAGLEYVAPPPQPVSVMLNEPPKQVGGTTVNEPADPWATLVDLDLNKKAAGDAPQRRASVNAGPSLNSQIKSGGIPPNDPFRSMAPVGNVSGAGPANPFGGPALGQPSGFGGGYPSGPGAGYGGMPAPMGMGGPAPVNPFGAGPAGPGPYGNNAGAYGGNPFGVAAQPAYGGVTPGYGMPNNMMGAPYGQPQQPKSSLDSLDWKM